MGISAEEKESEERCHARLSARVCCCRIDLLPHRRGLLARLAQLPPLLILRFRETGLVSFSLFLSQVTIFFSDIVGFTVRSPPMTRSHWAASMPPGCFGLSAA